jgi:hypothetical protein
MPWPSTFNSVWSIQCTCTSHKAANTNHIYVGSRSVKISVDSEHLAVRLASLLACQYSEGHCMHQSVGALQRKGAVKVIVWWTPNMMEWNFLHVIWNITNQLLLFRISRTILTTKIWELTYKLFMPALHIAALWLLILVWFSW